jgi:hypothetical protein
MRKTLLAAALTASTALTGAAHAMTFSEVPLDGGNGTAIMMQGDIDKGDAKRFLAFVDTVKDPKLVQVIKLDSIGGYISESLTMAATIKAMNRPTAVPNNAICASACFFLFAAGTERYVASTAKVGVHRASGTPQADTSSIKMAEEYKKMRIPDSIIVKMVTTASDDIAWLTQTDYNAMSVTVINPQPQVASTEQPTARPFKPDQPSQPAPEAQKTPYQLAYAECNRLWPRAVGNMVTRVRCLTDADEKYWLPNLGSDADLGRAFIEYRAQIAAKTDRGEITVDDGVKLVKDYLDNTTKAREARRAQVTPESQRPTTGSVYNPTPTQSPASAYDAGRRDRIALQDWAYDLEGPFRDGAEYWASVRSTPEASKGCDLPQRDPRWINGCRAAKAKIEPFDQRRNREPDYKAGWNSVPDDLVPVRPRRS